MVMPDLRTSARATPALDVAAQLPDEPRSRRGVVARTALVSRLRAANDAQIVTVVAPAGYGKTTLLAQWAERDPRPCAWLSLALPGNGDGLRSSVSGVVDSLRKRRWPRHPILLIVDGADVLGPDTALDIAALAENVPAGSTLALAARSEPRLPLARLRAEGGLLELGPDDLALTPKEAQSLLRHAGVLLPGPEVAELGQRTEGWPAGLYLAALSLRSGGDPWTFSGDDRFFADYLRAEHLSPLTPMLRRFLMRTSVLERMSPAICDAVLERKDSARQLDALERSSLLVVPLDRSRSAYRYRRLVRDFLRSELERLQPELVAVLNRRAADWCEANGAPEAAVDYAAAAGDFDHVARLVSRLALPAYQDGRIVMVERWLRLLVELPTLERHPDLCLIGAWVHALRGRAPDAQRWADAAERGLAEDDPRRRLLHALRCCDGTEQMLDDALAAVAAVLPGSIWQPTALVALGVAQHLGGDDDQRRRDTRARRRGGRSGRRDGYADRRAQRAFAARGSAGRACRCGRARVRGDSRRRLPPARRIGDARARARRRPRARRCTAATASARPARSRTRAACAPCSRTPCPGSRCRSASSSRARSSRSPTSAPRGRCFRRSTRSSACGRSSAAS